MNDGVIQYVPGDIANINVNEVVEELGCIEGMSNIVYIYYSQGNSFLRWYSVKYDRAFNTGHYKRNPVVQEFFLIW